MLWSVFSPTSTLGIIDHGPPRKWPWELRVKLWALGWSHGSSSRALAGQAMMLWVQNPAQPIPNEKYSSSPIYCSSHSCILALCPHLAPHHCTDTTETANSTPPQPCPLWLGPGDSHDLGIGGCLKSWQKVVVLMLCPLCQTRKLLDSIEVLCLTFWGNSLLFSIAAALFCIPKNIIKGY
jgi:hypothetical protein